MIYHHVVTTAFIYNYKYVQEVIGFKHWFGLNYQMFQLQLFTIYTKIDCQMEDIMLNWYYQKQ